MGLLDKPYGVLVPSEQTKTTFPFAKVGLVFREDAYWCLDYVVFVTGDSVHLWKSLVDSHYIFAAPSEFAEGVPKNAA